VVVGTPVVTDRYGERGYGLGMLLNSVGAYQMNMTARGEFIRGAVSRGPLYMDNRTVTGSALVDAVILEEGVASYPRVVLSQSCVEVVLATPQYIPTTVASREAGISACVFFGPAPPGE